ncbi:MAG: MG2 domain-containing protein, partial [Candidatus Sumerlaeota bacterium]|nr:MG2 domain-containing protein [Candidatus Sumerlaeota bacterium]
HITDKKIVLRTDLGLLAHWDSGALAVFVHDLNTLEPKAGARLSLYSGKNQLIQQGETDAQGMARFSNFNRKLGEPRVIVAEMDRDFTFLDLRPNDDDAREFANAKRDYDPEAYDGYIYADRDLYRPGETIHLRWIVRVHYGDALSSAPLLLTVSKPDGRALFSRPFTLSEFGAGAFDVQTQKTYPTGRYRVALTVPGEEERVGVYAFNLEEFVPNRMKASVTLPQAPWIGGAPRAINLTAMHLFGAPAANRKAEAEVRFSREPWRPERWKGYRFGNNTAFTPQTIACGEQATGADGTTSFALASLPTGDLTFPLQALVVGRVHELGGRAVSATTRTVFFASDVCLGLQVIPLEGDPGKADVRVAAIKPNEAPASLKTVTVTLERQVSNYYVRRYHDHVSPQWSQGFVEVETREVALSDGKGRLTLTPKELGYYRVKVSSPQTLLFSETAFYYYNFRVNALDDAKPSLIRLVADKAAYAPGEEARIRMESSFDGKGIVVLQDGAIRRMIPIDIKNGAGELRFAIEGAWYPNLWVEATVIHAIEKDHRQVYPFSSFAAISLKVNDPQRRIEVAFPDLPKELRPAQPATFLVEAKTPDGKPVEAELTLAAVDEGIHSITNYKNPDPLAWFERLCRPDLRRAHYYDNIAYDFGRPAPGGDGDSSGEIAKRLSAADENWIKPVALWSGVVRTDKTGRASVTMNLPEFNGQLRLVAVACDANASGAAGNSIFVRRLYGLQTSMPRFLLPEDAIQCRAVVYNRTDAPCKARVKWRYEGAMKQGEGSKELQVAPRGEAVAMAEFAAGRASGQGRIIWEAIIEDAAGKMLEQLKEVAPIPVRPPAAFSQRHETFILQPGESRVLRNTKFLDDERAEVELTVGANPQIRLQNALRHVLDYPYGCVEQTVSRLMPLYLFRQSASLLEAVTPKEANVDEIIQQGVNRLFSMQQSSGGLGYWPSSRETYAYGSVYALHFLALVANDRQFDLPQRNYEELKNYVRSIAKEAKGADASSLYLRAYAVYALSLGGDLGALEMIDRFDTMDIPRSGRFLLAAALARNTRDPDRVKLYLASTPSTPFTLMEEDGTLNSDVRNAAVELMTLRAIGGYDKQVHEKADQLIQFLEKNYYGTTQETAFIITALADYLSGIGGNPDAAVVTVAGCGTNAEVKGGKIFTVSHAGAGTSYTVANTGKAPLFINLTTRGIPETVDPKPVADGIAIRRNFYDRQGKPFEAKTFAHGATYLVALELDADKDQKNVIVADLLPAGFEIENSRLLGESMPGKKFPGAATPSHLEIRDDRIVLAFNRLSKGRSYYYYVVRAVTPGQYQYPPAIAECMYNAKVRGTSEATAIKIEASGK